MKKKTTFSIGAILLSTTLLTGLSHGQTRVPTPNETITQTQNNVSPPNQGQQYNAPALPPVPVSDQQVEQTRAHINGDFQPLNRIVNGGRIQDAWNGAEPNSGFYEYQACATCVYHGVLREHMVTSIHLPEGEIIDQVDVGDQGNFQVEVRGKNILTIKPHGFGLDTSMLVYGADGRTYPFYLRAEGVNSGNIPDLLIKVNGHIPHPGPDIQTGFVEKLESEIQAKYETELQIKLFEEKLKQAETQQRQAANDQKAKLNLSELTKDAKAAITDSPDHPDDANKDDFVQKIEFDPSKLHGFGQFKMWGENWSKKSELPHEPFRDENFTYIPWGDNLKNTELPVAYVVVDGVDELVNTRLQGTTLVIESTKHALIRLVRGADSYLCILYTGD